MSNSSNVNARRLVNYIENNLSSIMNNTIVDYRIPNNAHTQYVLRAQADAYMANLKQQGLVNDYKITCDTSNNSSESIQSGLLNVSVDINSMYPTAQYNWSVEVPTISQLSQKTFSISDSIFNEIKDHLASNGIEYSIANSLEEDGDKTIIYFDNDIMVSMFHFYIEPYYKIKKTTFKELK